MWAKKWSRISGTSWDIFHSRLNFKNILVQYLWTTQKIIIHTIWVISKIPHIHFSLYTIKRKRNIFKIYAYMIVKSMVLRHICFKHFSVSIYLTILGKSQFVCKPLKTLGKSRVLTFGTNRTNQKFSSLHIRDENNHPQTIVNSAFQ